MQELPLKELYDPIIVMFHQIESYENLYKELENRQKEQRKHRFVIEKLISMQDKKKELEKEKLEFEILYQNTNLTREQHRHLTNQDFEVDEEFYKIYQILEEQEGLANQLIQYDDPYQQGPSKLRGSLVENIDLIRQGAQSKLIAHLRKHYDNIEISELKKINNLFPNKLIEQIIFVLRYKFSNQLAPLLLSLNSQDKKTIKQFLTQLFQCIKETQQNINEIFSNNNEELFCQVIDNICQDYIQQLDTTLKFVEGYQTIFEVNIQLKQIVDLLSLTNVTCLIGFKKIVQLCASLKIKTIQNLTHNLQIIRFNIAQFSSYIPLSEQIDQLEEFLLSNQGQDREEIFNSLLAPFKQLIQMKLQQNNSNRSSKIFSINTLVLLIKRLKMFQFVEIQNQVELIIDEFINLKCDLVEKLKQENIIENAQKFKIQKEKNTGISKEQFKRLMKQMVQLDESGFRNDLFFEIELIQDEDLRQQIYKDIAESFTTQYYEPLYEVLMKYNQQNEFTTEIIQQLCTQYQVTTKDIYKIPLYIRDSNSYKLNMLNNQCL